MFEIIVVFVFLLFRKGRYAFIKCLVCICNGH